MSSLKDQLEYWLSKVTMYRLVTYCLTTLLSVAAVLSLTGYFAFSFASLLLSVTVFLITTYGSSRLFGWLFGVRPHGESSIITALILACLFIPPELSVLGFVKLALVGVIASASKYVLAVRGRHIFNPAAASTVIASVAGVAFAGWWIATPALLPVVLVIGFLILFKTRRLQMGGVFVAVAATLIIVQSVLLGLEFWQAAWFAFASWPIVFFAGVMLSEPLTQPPRRWQQLTIAVLIAILMSLPLRSEFISMTPALALVLGNLVAWWWGSRRSLSLTYVGRKQLTPTTYEFSFAGNVPFTAGQYIELTLPHKKADGRGIRRVFTIATSPGDKQLHFGIKIAEKSSTFKQALMNLHEAQHVQATRVAGDFVLPQDVKKPVLFVAGGIGITPLISYLRAYKNRDIILVYAASSADEIAYRDVLAVAGIKVIVVTPKGKVAHAPGGWKITKESRVTAELLKREVPDIKKRIVYVSGPPLMVNNVASAARKLGAKKVITDHFTGY